MVYGVPSILLHLQIHRGMFLFFIRSGDKRKPTICLYEFELYLIFFYPIREAKLLAGLLLFFSVSQVTFYTKRIGSVGKQTMLTSDMVPYQVVWVFILCSHSTASRGKTLWRRISPSIGNTERFSGFKQSPML